MDEKFSYSYSALTEAEKKEIERIKNEYREKDSRQITLEELRKLDAKVKNIPTIVALTIGVLGTLIFGLGMTFVLEWDNSLLGVILGAVGAIVATLAKPLHGILYKRLKARHGKKIIELSEKLIDSDREKQS